MDTRLGTEGWTDGLRARVGPIDTGLGMIGGTDRHRTSNGG